MKSVVQKIVLAGVVEYQKKILIVQRSADEDVFPNLWELPSGKRELFESSEDALVREIKEEVGLNIKPVSPFDVFDYKIEKEDEIRDSTQISFLCKPINKPKVKLSGEHQNFTWISESEVGNYALSNKTKAIIKKAFNLFSK